MSMARDVSAVVPVKDLRGTKSRLAPILDPGARAGLTLYMMGRVVCAIAEAGVEDVCVVSPDRMVLEEAKRRGATPLVQESRGLNPALEEGRRRAMELGASALLVRPADLPLLELVHLRHDPRRAARPGVLGLAVDQRDHLVPHVHRRHQQLAVRPLERPARQVVEQLDHVLRDRRVGGEQAQVGVEVGGLGVVVAGADVAVRAQPLGLLADH